MDDSPGDPRETTQALAQHQLWLKGRGGKRMELRLTNLSGLKLTGFDFSRGTMLACNLSQADLRGSRFVEADLTNSLFIGSDLRRCDFTRANLRGTRFYKSDMQSAVLDGSDLRVGTMTVHRKTRRGGDEEIISREYMTDLSYCNMEGASLQGAVLRKAQLRGVNFRGADLAKADFSGADMQGVILLGAKLDGANFFDTDIRDAVFTLDDTTRRLFKGNPFFVEFINGLKEVDRMLIQHEKWVEAGGRKGARADFTGQSLRGVDLRGRELSAVSFKGADLTAAKLSHAKLAAADFSGATLHYTDMGGADLRGADFGSAHLLHTSFEAADLTDLMLRDGGALPTRFGGARLEWTTFARALFDPARLHGAERENIILPD